MIPALLVLLGFAPIAVYFWREHKLATPALQWPALGKILALQYEANPPRLSGKWTGRPIAVESGPAGATVTAWLSAATSLRVECGLKDLVTKRAGVLVPDPVEPLDKDFRDKLLARCSDKAAGPTVFDVALQQRLAGLPHVDFVGSGTRVIWTVPVFKDPDAVEALFGALCAVADGLESFPQGGGLPRA